VTNDAGDAPDSARAERSQSRTNGSNDGEVVDKPEGWSAVEAAGRKVPDGRVRPLSEQDQAGRASDADEERQAEPECHPQTSPPGDLYGDPSRWHSR
jgi:hypothetical protein